MSGEFIIAIDQGTTGSRVFCYDLTGRVIAGAYREFTQYFPRPGWVEHDAVEIWEGVTGLLGEVLEKKDLDPKKALGIGITNQRETVVLWERESGRPLHHAIVWQCRRTADRCLRLKEEGREEMVRRKTGLVIDAYFSATKIGWLLDNVAGLREEALRGKVAAGTMDSYLLFRLTGEHATDYTNASRTLLYDIEKKRWDEELLDLFGEIPPNLLPIVASSRGRFGVTRNVPHLPDGIPVLSMAGDQQAATFGQLCTEPGEAKNTYGTGCFLVFNTGDRFLISKSGLLTTLACNDRGGVCYALEGSVFIAGAVVQWLRDYLKFFESAGQTESLIADIPEAEESVVVVPAFVGLGAPHWDMNARGAIFGLTRDTTPAVITRAALKSIALQSLDLVEAMENDTGQKMPFLRVDGGATANNYLMQYQADILNRPVERPQNVDTTALGVAYLAGIEAGVWRDGSELRRLRETDRLFEPGMSGSLRETEIRFWRKAVDRTRNWLD